MIILATIFFILGVIGLLIPVIPQVPFFVAGVLLMSAVSPRFRNAVTGTKLYRKYLKKHIDNNVRLSAMLNA